MTELAKLSSAPGSARTSATHKALIRELVERFGEGAVVHRPDALAAYECDGFTIHKHRPLAVVLPATTAEVQDVVRLCRAHDTAFLPRGAGTCLSGGPTPTRPTVVIETARMKHVLEICPEDGYAVVQPGVVNLALTRQSCRHGMHYAPDPSSQAVCTIGGNLAENSGGPHCFKYGMTTDHVLGATVVLADGEVATLGGPAGPRAPHELDLIGLFTGSEGTFGIATEIVVRLQPDPEAVRTLLGAFRSMEDACATVATIVASGMVPTAMEVLDQATIRAVEASVFRAGYPEDAAAVLLVELDGPPSALSEEVPRIEAAFAERNAISIETAATPDERQRLWKGRKGAYGAMGRLAPDLYLLDGVVPRNRLVDTLQKIHAIGQRHGVTLVNFFHAGDGNLHPTISYDGRDEDQRERVVAAGHEILKACMDAGGSITGEHGIGTEKLDHVSLMFSADDLEVMRRARTAFDPSGLCNPGKVIPERASCAEVGRSPELVERILDAQREQDEPREGEA